MHRNGFANDKSSIRDEYTTFTFQDLFESSVETLQSHSVFANQGLDLTALDFQLPGYMEWSRAIFGDELSKDLQWMKMFQAKTHYLHDGEYPLTRKLLHLYLCEEKAEVVLINRE